MAEFFSILGTFRCYQKTDLHKQNIMEIAIDKENWCKVEEKFTRQLYTCRFALSFCPTNCTLYTLFMKWHQMADRHDKEINNYFFTLLCTTCSCYGNSLNANVPKKKRRNTKLTSNFFIPFSFNTFTTIFVGRGTWLFFILSEECPLKCL